MAYEQKDLTGSLFKNDRKETDSHPDYKGSALIDGVNYWLDAWINEVKTGEKTGQKYMSLKLKPKDAQNGVARPTQAAQPMSQFDDDSDTPF